MTIFASLPVENKEPVNAVRDLLARLLDTELVSAVLVAVETQNGRSVQPSLIRDTASLSRANPFLPVMPISAARMATFITRRFDARGNGASAPRIAVVMRPCELRATVELAKLQQIAYEQLLTIGIDCVGTFEVSDMQTEDAHVYLEKVLEAANHGEVDSPNGLPYRHACSICTNPVAWQPDIAVHTIGVDNQQEILLEVNEESLVEKLELQAGADATAHQTAVQRLIAVRQERRDTALDTMSEKLQMRDDGTPGLLVEFEDCQRCHNCTVACPMCYCKTCLFRTNTFEHEPQYYMDVAERKGAMRLPGDTLTFHLTRLAHMSLSCIGCGLCTSACPADLPVDTLFQTVARQTQSIFDYVPGRNLDELLPIATFETDEFQDLGERVAT